MCHNLLHNESLAEVWCENKDSAKARFRFLGIQITPSTHVDTVCLLSRLNAKPDTRVKLTLDMDDYYRIVDQEK